MLYCSLDPSVTEDAMQMMLPQITNDASSAFHFPVEAVQAHLCKHEASGDFVIVIIFEPVKSQYVM
jgi:hypothetical protein